MSDFVASLERQAAWFDRVRRNGATEPPPEFLELVDAWARDPKDAAAHPTDLAQKLAAKSGDWGRKWIYIGAALTSGRPELLDLVVEMLADRSPHIKDRVLMAMEADPRLHTPRAAELLRRVLKMKQADRLYLSREKMEALAARIEAGASGKV